MTRTEHSIGWAIGVLLLALAAVCLAGPNMARYGAVWGGGGTTPSGPYQPTGGLIWWDFNDGYPMITVSDGSGNNRTVQWQLATVAGANGLFPAIPYDGYNSSEGHPYASSTNGSARMLVGDNSHAIKVGGSSIFGPVDYSLAGWVKPGATQAGIYASLWSVGDGVGNANTTYDVTFETTEWAILDCNVAWGTHTIAWTTNWTHVCLSVTNLGKNATLFINGAVGSVVANASHTQTNTAMLIGGAPSAFVGFKSFIGLIGEFRAYSGYAMTQTDATNAYLGTWPTNTPDVWLRFPTNTDVSPYVPFGEPWQNLWYGAGGYWPTITGGVTTFTHPVAQRVYTNYNLSAVETSITISVWAKPTGLSNGYHVAVGASDLNVQPAESWFLILGNADDAEAAIEFGSNIGGRTFFASSNGTWSASDMTDWHHIVASYSPGDGGKIYKDGVSLALATNTYNGLLGTNTSVSIGLDADDGTSHRYYGSLDDLRIWGRQLTDGEVSLLYSGGRTNSSRDYVP